jgi:lysophospholipase L1-like esterase
MTRFAALGDSITFGMGDPMPDGSWRGFAALLAPSLTGLGVEVEFHNLATSGAKTGDVATDQLNRAQALQPQVATLLIGMNDVLRGAFDLVVIGHNLHRVIEELTAAGTLVATGCLPEPGRMLRLPGALARPLGRRVRAINELIHALSHRYRLAHTHLGLDPQVFAPGMWSIDRLHPSELGHRRLAGAFHEALAEHGCPVGERPSPRPTQVPPSRLAQAWWMATKGTRWIMRRSTDLVPHLVKLAWVEWLLTRRGEAEALDARMVQEVATALAALPVDPVGTRRVRQDPRPGVPAALPAS